MSEARLDIKLTKYKGALKDKKGLEARLAPQGVVDFDGVVEEVVDGSGLGLRPEVVKMVLDLTLSTMVRKCREDGRARRVGDYFLMQPQVRGHFDSFGDPFDPARHTLALALRPLKALREHPADRRREAVVRNRAAGPLVVIKTMRAASTPDADGLVWGDDIVLRGENLKMLYGDPLHLSVVTATTTLLGAVTPPKEGLGSADELVVPWGVLADSIQRAVADGSLDPGNPQPIRADVMLHSRGGVRLVKHQTHHKNAFFADYAAAHPGAKLPRLPHR